MRSCRIWLRSSATRLGPAVAALVCLVLALLAQGAELAHRHSVGLECEETHVERPAHACGDGLASAFVAPEDSGLDAPAGESCLVCRWSRGPLAPPAAVASLPAPPDSSPLALSRARFVPSSTQRPGFLTRAPPALG